MRAGVVVALLVGLGLTSGLACSSEESEPPSAQTQEEESSPAAMTIEEPPRPALERDENRSVAERIEDASLGARVKEALASNRSLRAFYFDLEVIGGHVTLRGDVSTEGQYDRAAAVAEEVDGVKAVANEVTVEGRPVVAEADQEEGGTNQQQTRSAGHHVVRAGESLWTIARRYGTSTSRLRELNNLGSNSLQPGQRLVVPGGNGARASSGDSDASSQEGASSATYYTVQRGESLWIVARKNNTTVARLRELNNLRSNNIQPGDRLRVQ